MEERCGAAEADHPEVLGGKHGGRREQADLPAVADRPVDRAHRHLRLAEAHVAADEPIHRPVALHLARVRVRIRVGIRVRVRVRVRGTLRVGVRFRDTFGRFGHGRVDEVLVATRVDEGHLG